MLLKEMIAVYSYNHTKPINILGKTQLLIVKAGGTFMPLSFKMLKESIMGLEGRLRIKQE
jgi:hypothetical protein